MIYVKIISNGQMCIYPLGSKGIGREWFTQIKGLWKQGLNLHQSFFDQNPPREPWELEWTRPGFVELNWADRKHLLVQDMN